MLASLDDNPNGMRSDFERSVAFLLPTDPVKKKRGGGKRNAGQISATVAAATGDRGEMVQRMPHSHPLYCPDNAARYAQLVTSTLGT